MGRPVKYIFERKHLIRLRAARMGTVRIAKIYGCDPTTVRRALIAMGLPTQFPAVTLTDEMVEKKIRKYRQHCEWAVAE